jgi:hypothetical protein
MAITTRTAKGSQLTTAEMDTNLTDLNAGAVKTAYVTIPQGGSYTVPDGTGNIIHNGSGTQYSTTVVFPLNPVDGQLLTISSPVYALGNVTVSGNGKTIAGPSVLDIVATGTASWRYTAGYGWVPVYRDKLNTQNAAGVRELIGYTPNGGGWRWTGSGSWDYYLYPGTSWHQSTASGIQGGTNHNNCSFLAQNTINVTDANSSNGRYSWAGFQAQINNSSVAFGGGATNNAQVELIHAVTCRNSNSANFAAVAGVGVHLNWNNAPYYFVYGGNSPVLRAQFDILGNFRTVKMVCDESEQRDTGTASFTVADNTTNVLLAGSGTITVTFPATPVNGQELVISLETAYTAVTLAGNGKTIITGAALGVSAGSFARYRYRAANTTWHRVG